MDNEIMEENQTRTDRVHKRLKTSKLHRLRLFFFPVFFFFFFRTKTISSNNTSLALAENSASVASLTTGQTIAKNIKGRLVGNLIYPKQLW
jgi:hypothetical protein